MPASTDTYARRGSLVLLLGQTVNLRELSATRALAPAIQTHQLSKGHSWPTCRARPGMDLPSQAGSAAGGTNTP